MYKRICVSSNNTVEFPPLISNPVHSLDSELPVGSVYDRDIQTATFITLAACILILGLFSPLPTCIPHSTLCSPRWLYSRALGSSHAFPHSLVPPMYLLTRLLTRDWWLIVIPCSYLLPYQSTHSAPRSLMHALSSTFTQMSQLKLS